MIDRIITPKLKHLMTLYPIVLLTGPRQSGKSTLLKNILPDYDYISLEDLDERYYAQNDPRGFIAAHPDKTIIDEAQLVPSLFSYLQTHIDNEQREGMFVLSGSQNFLLMEQISQSLAGRVAILELMPFSRNELKAAGLLSQNVWHEIFAGGYPRLHDKQMHPTEYYPYYIRTYVERDVRQLKNISDLSLFTKFIKLCAGRIGQILNISSIANDCGIAVSTAQAWLSVLETSYIIYMLRPDYNNFSKRLVKSPKLYFRDTGLACSLLEIKEANQLENHYLNGGLFENYVINQFLKASYNEGKEPHLSFWRDSVGNEIDLIDSSGEKQIAYEIKSAQTFSTDFVKGLHYWSKLSHAEPSECNVVYAGKKAMQMTDCNLLTLNEI